MVESRGRDGEQREMVKLPRRTAVTLGVAIAAATAVAAAVVASARSGAEDATEACGEEFTIGKVTYVAVAAAEPAVLGDRRLRSAGPAACTDAPGQSATNARLDLRPISGVPVTTAVADRTRPDVVFAARGRCADGGGWPAFSQCIGTRLRFDRRTYVRTRLRSDSGPVEAGTRLGTGRLVVRGKPGRRIFLWSIRGIDPTLAISTSRPMGAIYVADGSCYVEASAAMRDCLTTAS